MDPVAVHVHGARQPRGHDVRLDGPRRTPEQPGGDWIRQWGRRWLGDNTGEDERARWRPTLEALPYAATVHLPNGGRVGLVHGYTMLRDEREADWDELCE